MNAQIENAIKTGRGYWFVDGFTEILGGMFFILLGAILAAAIQPAQGSFLAQFVSLAGIIGLVKLVGLLVAGLLIWWLKDRFTYPRTGFVRGMRPTRTQTLAFLRNAALGLLLPLLLLAAALIWLPGPQGWIASLPVWLPVLIGAIWAVLCILAGHWMGLRRFELLGGLILLAGISIAALQLATRLPANTPDQSLANAFFSLCLLTMVSGKFFAISGLVVFLRYRKANPQPFQEAS